MNQIRSLVNKLNGFNKNINLYIIFTFLINFGFGVFRADFNLYILSMGISPDFLGIILSLTPFAQVLAAIPIGFFAEKIGNKKTLVIVNLIVGLSYFLRVISPNQALILIGSFMIGTVQAAYFIVKLPFISRYAGKNRDRDFVFQSLAFSIGTALGNLAGGYLPGLLNSFIINETITFRLIMIGAALIILSGTVPLLFLDKDEPEDTKKISLSPYLHGIDKNTIKFAVIEFFLGTGLGFLLFFMNVIFIYHFNSTLEFFGSISAFLIFPSVLFLFASPYLARKFTGLNIVMAGRVISTIAALIVAITVDPIVGGSAYLLFRALLGMNQSLWISYASSVSTRRSRTATSTWLEITFQIGFAIAAIYGGKLIARENYHVLGYISSASMFTAFLLTYIFFSKTKIPENQ